MTCPVELSATQMERRLKAHWWIRRMEGQSPLASLIHCLDNRNASIKQEVAMSYHCNFRFQISLSTDIYYVPAIRLFVLSVNKYLSSIDNIAQGWLWTASTMNPVDSFHFLRKLANQWREEEMNMKANMSVHIQRERKTGHTLQVVQRAANR